MQREIVREPSQNYFINSYHNPSQIIKTSLCYIHLVPLIDPSMCKSNSPTHGFLTDCWYTLHVKGLLVICFGFGPVFCCLIKSTYFLEIHHRSWFSRHSRIKWHAGNAWRSGVARFTGKGWSLRTDW